MALFSWRGGLARTPGKRLPRERRTFRAFRPGLEVLEDRRLLSFAPPVVTVFGNASQIGQTAALAAGDLNGDGRPDLVTSVNNLAGGGDVVSLLNNGTGGYNQATGSPFSDGGTQPITLVLGDVNKDGRLDVVTASSRGMGVLLGNGNGTFTAVQGSPFSAGNSPIGVALGDFNGDGNLDAAVAGGGANGTLTILLGNGTGTFTQSGPPISVGANPNALISADFNGDNRADLAVAIAGPTTGAPGSVVMLLGNGDGTFTPATGSPFAAGVNPRSVVAADFNGDGRLDVATLNGNVGAASDVSVLLNNGTGVLTPLAGSPFATGGTNSVTIATADFNADGRPDVAIANVGASLTSPGSASVLINDGTGRLVPATGSPFTSGGLATSGVATLDYNSDGLPDIALMSPGSTSVSTLLNIGLTGTMLVATANANQTVTGVVTVIGAASGQPPPTGIVTLTEGTTLLASGAVVNGQATVTTGVLSPGTHTIVANYSGSTTFAASHSLPVSVIVRFVSNVTVTASPSPATAGQPVTFTATISSSLPGPAVTGTVAFADGTTLLGTATVGANGQATFTTSALTAGSHVINVGYSGDTNYAPGGTSLILQVNAGPTPPPVFGTAIQNFVRALYQQVLHRAADAAGFNDWVTRLQSGQFTREQVATRFLTSAERYTIVVAQFYQTLLGRAPDPGAAFWITGLVNGTLSQSDVVIGFVTSQEFTHDFPTNVAYVGALYQRLLGRNPSNDELVGQTHVLDIGLSTRGFMAFGFLASAEAANDAIVSFYTCILRRQPTAGETQGWLSLIFSGQTDPISAEATFLGGTEYFGLVQVVAVNQLQFC
jgi:hypothetical protein